MGEDTQKTSTGLNNKALNGTITKLSQGLSALYKPGGTTYVAPSANTTGSWASALQAAGNPDYTGGIAGALKSYGNRAAGNEIGLSDPAYAAVRSGIINDVTGSVNSSFNNSGLFGSDSNRRGLAEGLTGSLGALDLQQLNDSYGRQAEAAGLLPQLFAAGLAPSSVMAGVGGSQDEDASARQNGQLDYISRLTAALNPLAAVSGTTTTTKTKSDPFRTVVGGGLGLLGLL
jgi:hypothetical protein